VYSPQRLPISALKTYYTAEGVAAEKVRITVEYDSTGKKTSYKEVLEE